LRGSSPSSRNELLQVAESLIVKGKELGYLLPDDILEAFPEMEAEPDQVFRIFQVFTEMGIEVTDGDKDSEQVEPMDDTLLIDIEMADSVPFDDPLRLYLKEIGRVSLLTAAMEVCPRQGNRGRRCSRGVERAYSPKEGRLRPPQADRQNFP